MDAGEELTGRANKTFEGVLRRLKRRHLEASLNEMRVELKDAEARGEDTAELVRRIQNLTRKKQELKRSDQTA